MDIYWDLTEKERAALTEEQVRGYLAVELMSKGLTTPKPPEYEEEAAVELETTTYYQIVVDNLEISPLFESADDASSIIALFRLTRDSGYWHGNTAYAKPVGDVTVKPVDLPSEAQVDAHKVALEEAKKKKDANSKKRRTYDDAVRETNKATDEVWDDWRNCINTERYHQAVVDTLQEYTTLADGDQAMAMKFLRRAHTERQIMDAFEWFEIEYVAPDPDDEDPQSKDNADSSTSTVNEIPY